MRERVDGQLPTLCLQGQASLSLVLFCPTAYLVFLLRELTYISNMLFKMKFLIMSTNLYFLLSSKLSKWLCNPPGCLSQKSRSHLFCFLYFLHLICYLNIIILFPNTFWISPHLSPSAVIILVQAPWSLAPLSVTSLHRLNRDLQEYYMVLRPWNCHLVIFILLMGNEWS